MWRSLEWITGTGKNLCEFIKTFGPPRNHKMRKRISVLTIAFLHTNTSAKSESEVYKKSQRSEEDEKCRRRKVDWLPLPPTKQNRAGGRSPKRCSFLYSRVVGCVGIQTMNRIFGFFFSVFLDIETNFIARRWKNLQRCRFFVSVTKLFLDLHDDARRASGEMIAVHRKNSKKSEQQQFFFMF